MTCLSHWFFLRVLSQYSQIKVTICLCWDFIIMFCLKPIIKIHTLYQIIYFLIHWFILINFVSINRDLNILCSRSTCTWQACLALNRLWVLGRCRWFCRWFIWCWCTGDSRAFSSRIFSIWQSMGHLRTFLWSAIRTITYWFISCCRIRCKWILIVGGGFELFSKWFMPLSGHQEQRSLHPSFVFGTIIGLA